jgi:hypothetical protein
MRYCTSVAVLLGEGDVIEPMEDVWEAVVAAVVDDDWEINVVAIAEVEVIPSADSVPGTHWSIIRPLISTLYMPPCCGRLAVICVIRCASSACCAHSGAGILSTSALTIDWHICPHEGRKYGGDPSKFERHGWIFITS